MSSDSGSTPTATQYNNTTIPDYAKPYVETMLGQTQALTDINQNPYQQYGGQRVAQWTPMQNQAFQGAETMGPASELALASTGAQNAMNAAQNQKYNYKDYNTGSFTDKGTADAYMNPYMQNVVARQQQDAARQAAIAQQTQQAQAARSGAFGGSGDYLMRAQAAGNLARQKGDIQATGLNNAYQQGMQQFNAEQQARQQAANLNAQQGQFGAGLGLQGLQTALTGANALTNIGQNAYNQNMGINQLQNQYGTQQQNQVQKVLDTGYQDFQNYQNYPYKQLGFMSDMLRGLPLSGSGSKSMYEQAPSLLTQMGGAAATGKAIGVYKDGGSVSQRPAGLAELALYQIGQG